MGQVSEPAGPELHEDSGRGLSLLGSRLVPAPSPQDSPWCISALRVGTRGMDSCVVSWKRPRCGTSFSSTQSWRSQRRGCAAEQEGSGQPRRREAAFRHAGSLGGEPTKAPERWCWRAFDGLARGTIRMGLGKTWRAFRYSF